MDEKNKNVRKIELRHDTNLDDVVNTLKALEVISPEKFFVNFNGVKLYSSDDLTLDDAYQQVYGDTRSEYYRKADEVEKNWRETAEASKKQAETMIKQRYEEGIKYIYPERFKEWKEWLEFRARSASFDPESAKYPDVIIECLKRLENGEDFESVFKFVKNSSELDRNIGTAWTLLDFSKVGPEYVEYVYKKENGADISGKQLEMVKAKKEENRKLAQLHKSERQVSVSEVAEVAKGEARTSKNGAINAVTTLEGKVQEQSHDDE